MKKGAMFGLDARIALAIFGALSVISGAALYSAIQDSKTVAIIADLEEMNKAYEQYLLDTGLELPVSQQSLYLNSHQLVDNNLAVDAWNGPYIGYETQGPNHVLKYPRGVDIFLAHGLSDTWTAWVGTSSDYQCVSNKICAVYSGVDELTQSQAEAIDKYIDGSVDYYEGRVKIFPISNNYHVFLKHRPTLTQL